MHSHRATPRLRTVRRALALSAVAVLTIGGTAVADDVSNDLDTSVDATAEVMALNVGGAAGTTKLYLVNRNGDGKQGCNLTGNDTSLGVAVSSSNPDVATASISNASFDNCGDERIVTVHAVAQGTTTVTVGQESNTTGGTYDFTPATFTVNVSAAAPANTAPQVSVTGVTPGASYDKGSVPDATCSVTDAEDGPSSFPATLSDTFDADGLGAQTASCSYTDAGELIASASVTYLVVDPSAPTIGYTVDPTDPDGLDGWYRNSVTLTWHVTEPESAGSLQKTGCEDQLITADQAATTYTCAATSSGGSTGPVSVTLKRDGNGPLVAYDASQTSAPDGDNGWYVSPVTATFTATDGFSGVSGASTKTATSSGDGSNVVVPSPGFADNAGNTTAAGAADSEGFKIDTVAPSIDPAVLSGTMGDNGWYVTDVDASFTAQDETSGVAGTNPRTVSSGGTQGTVTLSSPAFSDVAGNDTAAGAKSTQVKIDTVDPSVGLDGGPADGQSYYFGSVPSAPTCEASDATSGVSGACAVSGYATGVGTHTVTATAKDNAGNSTTVSRTYTVLAWDAKGFYQPVDMNGVLNKVKGGSTVPLKFELFAGSTEITDTAAISTFKYSPITCSATAPVDTIELLSSGGTTLRYDATGGQFIQNWKVPTTLGCYSVTLTANDGTALNARFQVTK
jgi:hypothetical protein